MSALGEALRTYIKDLIDNQKLVNLTNDSNTSGAAATTIDDDRLLVACETALGEFRIRSGKEPDTTTPVYAHMSILKNGVLYILMESKLYDSSVVNNHKKEFLLGCKMIRENLVIDVETSSKTTRTQEKLGGKPDMDLGKAVMRGRRSALSPSQINND